MQNTTLGIPALVQTEGMADYRVHSCQMLMAVDRL
jgi:hypothetical protein